jgi:hypothetical protein
MSEYSFAVLNAKALDTSRGPGVVQFLRNNIMPQSVWQEIADFSQPT